MIRDETQQKTGKKPWKINREPTNHPFRKENDLNQTSRGVSEPSFLLTRALIGLGPMGWFIQPPSFRVATAPRLQEDGVVKKNGQERSSWKDRNHIQLGDWEYIQVHYVYIYIYKPGYLETEFRCI